MTYVMGFVAAVPTANKQAYQDFAESSVEYFKRLGVTRMLEAWGDDVPRGDATDFYRAVAAEDGEAIVYSLQTYPDAAKAAEANEKMMNDPEMAAMDMPFDGARMIYGGFETIAEAAGEGRAGYVEGSIIAVPETARAAYADYAKKLGKLFIAHGAVRSVDAWGVDVPDGKHTDFRRAVAAKPGEAVVFGWIEWPSKATRDTAWAAMMDDPLLQEESAGADEGRRVFGGFVPILDR